MMTATFTDDEIQSMACEAVENVFSTMLDKPIELQKALSFPTEDGTKPELDALDEAAAQLSSSIGFAGKVNGIMHLTMLDSLASSLSCAFLGMEPEELEEEGVEVVDDAMGELANMVAGDFKNRLCDKGHQCMLTLPSVMHGNNLQIQAKMEDGARRHNYHFQTCSSSFIVDLIFKHTD